MTNRFNQLFANPQRKAFIPFFTLGDPNPESSFELICTAVDAGADALELGFPFSDPITDGPVNQRSMHRALKAGTNYETCLTLLRRIRIKYPSLPIGLLLYYNLLYMRGSEAYAEFSEIGIDAIVCSDLPFDESEWHMQKLADTGLGCIQMIAPNTPSERAVSLLKHSSAFTYVISRFGTTGTNEHFETEALTRIESLSQVSTQPIVVGFGISKVPQVQDFWKHGANGVIIGSLFSLQIENSLHDIPSVQAFIDGFISEVQASKAC
ncbi:tryptophan synthase subunit alpha [Comamonas testosteroni]|uniref:tryptophan synthase subunit alpha n=1 Tax=Comamonas testosteroni TaxID=285 RepID=UPI0026ED190F|nr:tryptophan synthase subunit alpha [Comamonas testosteroni]WQD41386.1 tryptophan synthase subunit alpha [Comamonas testosteroni]